jgi:hypothetical protein
MCGTVKRNLKNETGKETQIRFYKTLSFPVLTYKSET